MSGRVLTTLFIGLLLSGCAAKSAKEPSSGDHIGSATAAAEATALDSDPIQLALGDDVDWHFQSAAMVWEDGASVTDYEWRTMIVTEEELIQLHRDDKSTPYQVVRRTSLNDIAEISGPRVNGGDGVAQPSYLVNISTAVGENFRIQMSSGVNAGDFAGWIRHGEPQQSVRETSDAYKTNRRTSAKRSPVL